MDERIETTIKTYNESIDEYEKTNNTEQVIENIKPFREDFVKNTHGKKIIDIGFGDGRDMKYFHDKGFEVYGIDNSIGCLLKAEKKVPEAEIQLLDMRNLTDVFEPNTFDAIWAMSSYLHIPPEDATHTINQFNTILKKDGLMFLCVYEGEGDEIKKSGSLGGKERYFNYYKPDEFKQLITDNGFKIIKEIVERDWINIFATKL